MDCEKKIKELEHFDNVLRERDNVLRDDIIRLGNIVDSLKWRVEALEKLLNKEKEAMK